VIRTGLTFPDPNPGNQPPNGCFVAGTKVTMSDGSQKNIEDIKVGEQVLSYNLNTKQVETSTVEEIESPIHTKLVSLTFANGQLNTNTLDHPYFVKGKGWASYDPQATIKKYQLQVAQMNIDDIVLHYNVSTKVVDEIKLVQEKFSAAKQKTYNLRKVSKNHNFFANQILVHNKFVDTNKKAK